MMEPFPEKPKGMHWSTYERLWWEHHEADMEQLAGMRVARQVREEGEVISLEGFVWQFLENGRWEHEGDRRWCDLARSRRL
jgi:hypothetical protein